jgi:transcriptional regulator with XRE-family HTH domain
MNQNISQQELGQRISGLRQFKGLSQDDLANQIELSRSSLAQIELGNRKLNVIELQKISHVLGFTLDNFLSQNFSIEEFSNAESKDHSESDTYRISEPTLNINKFSNVLLYILERCAGKPNVGETLIYKLLYFSDFNYYELYEEHLTGAKYHKLPYGPVPHKVQSIINKMINDDKSIKRIKTDYHNHKQTRYIPLKKTNLQELKASETEILDRVIEQFSDWSAAAISEYSHKDIPWLVSKEGEEINYELALYREAPYSVRNYDEEN